MQQLRVPSMLAGTRCILKARRWRAWPPDAAQASNETAVAEALQKTAREQLKRSRQLISQGNYREATTPLSRAASLDPSLIEARILLATIFDLQGMSERAAYYYKDVIDRRQHINDREAALALNNRGYSLCLTGEYKEAKKLISQAVELDSTNARFLNNLGVVNYRLNKHKDAAQAFAKVGGELQGNVNVAILFEQDGRFSEAIKYYERARRINPSSELVLQRLQILHDRGARQMAKSEISSGYLIPSRPKR
ncbi:MAG: tetratricopeptide repeat protein [Pyrinomonadaceae bacterium]